MHDFTYINSCKIIFGRDKLDELANAVLQCGRKVLLVYGQKSIKQSGVHARTVDLLLKAGIAFAEHGGVKSNPVLSHALDGIEAGKRNGVDCILAVGGGSVIDEAKVIAVGAVSDRRVWSFFEEGPKPREALPVVAVPTLPAAGSEVNPGAVLTNTETGEKLGITSPCMIPRVAIMDPTLTFTLPRKYLVYGLVDAFSHVLEGYFNGKDLFSPVQDAVSEGLCRALIQTCRNVLSDPESYDYRSDAMWAACLAHDGSLNMGRGKILFEMHSIAHVIGALFDVPHGAAISVVMPAWMHFRIDRIYQKAAQFAENVFGMRDTDKRRLFLQGTDALRGWLKESGAFSSLLDLGIERSSITQLRDKIEATASAGLLAHSEPKDRDRLMDLLF